MSNILSQEEVTALLNAAVECDFTEPAKPRCSPTCYVADYMTCEHIEKLWGDGIADNRRAGQYSKAQRKAFTGLFEEIAANVSERFSKRMGKECVFETVSVDELTTSELLMSLSSPAYIRLFKLPKAADCGIYEVNPTCLHSAVTAKDAIGEEWWARKTLTQEELQTGEFLGNLFFDEIAKVFNTVSSVRFRYADKRVTVSPQGVNAALIPSNVFVASIEALMQPSEGLLSFVFPPAYVNFLLLTQSVKQESGCVKDNFCETCKRCRLLQEHLKREFRELAERATKSGA